MRRRLLAAITTLSLALFLALALLRMRAEEKTDVLMLAAPGGRCVLLTSHEGKWVTATVLRDWPDRGIAWWSAQRLYITTTSPRINNQSWNRAGPFLFWQRHWTAQTAGVTTVHGTIAVPADDGGKLPAYGDGYDRADADNAWRGVLPGQKGWLFLSGWEVRCPHTYLMALTAPLPLVVIPVWLMRRLGRRRRFRAGLCVGCGYDVRASAERCPECGRPIPLSVRPTDTAPAAIAP